MKCPNCGNEYMDGLVTCPACYEKARSAGKDTDSFRYAVLGYLLPIVGWFLSKKWQHESPMKAKTVKNGALLGFAFWAACLVAFIVVVLVMNYVD